MASGETVVITANSGNYSTVAPCVVTIPVASVTIAGGDFTLKEGDAKKLAATVAPVNATDKTVTWTSSDAAVATVDASGTVKAVKAGTATITATAGGKSATVKVTVTGEEPVVPVQSVSISGSGVSNGKATISVGANLNLTATVSPSNATVGAVYWSSSDTSVATVDGSGRVSAKAEGVTAITVTAGGRSQAIILTVTAAPRFADVPFDHQFYADIEWLAASGITNGDGSGNYSPWANVNRGQMAAFMYRMAVKRGNALAATYKPSAADYNRFPDVGRDTQFSKEILWAASVGLTNGDGSGGFSPYADCNRAQMSAFLQRFARLHGDALAGSYKPSAADYNRFPDVGRDHHFANSILWAASVGLTNGDGSGGFSPYADCNRAQMAAFLHRLDNHL